MYSSIPNAVHTDMVTRHIENREHPLSEVAVLLGFSSSSTFRSGLATSSAAVSRNGERVEQRQPKMCRCAAHFAWASHCYREPADGYGLVATVIVSAYITLICCMCTPVDSNLLILK
jgi:hypothetical protein